MVYTTWIRSSTSSFFQIASTAIASVSLSSQHRGGGGGFGRHHLALFAMRDSFIHMSELLPHDDLDGLCFKCSAKNVGDVRVEQIWMALPAGRLYL